MPSATMTSKGQITIPIEIRRKLRLEPGTKVDFVENGSGKVELRAKSLSILDLAGIVKHDGPSVTIEEMDEAIAEAINSRVFR